MAKRISVDPSVQPMARADQRFPGSLLEVWAGTGAGRIWGPREEEEELGCRV